MCTFFPVVNIKAGSEHILCTLQQRYMVSTATLNCDSIGHKKEMSSILGVAGFQPMSTAVHMEPKNKLSRSNSILNLWVRWMGTQRVQMKGVLTWLVHWACLAGTSDFCSALAALVGPTHYFNSFVSMHRPVSLGWQSYWVACLIVCLSDIDKKNHNHVVVRHCLSTA